LAGFAYGPPAPQGAFWGIPGPDETGTVMPRFPLQLIAAITMLGFAFWLETRKPTYQKEGQRAALMLLGMAANLLIFTPLRIDPVPRLLGLRLDIWFAALIFLFSAWFYYYSFYISERQTENTA
jgi:hypothetical protein